MTDKILSKFKELSNVLDAIYNSEQDNYYKRELNKLATLARAPDGGLSGADFNRLRYILDFSMLGLVLKLMGDSDDGQRTAQ